MDAGFYWLLYGLTGAVAGVFAGLLGVGGGVVVVPALIFVMQAQGIAPDYMMHMAVGTSLAIIMCTSLSSVRSHHKRGMVIWPIVWKIAAGILIGTYLGSILAAHLSSRVLQIAFSIFLYLVAVQLLLKVRPKPTRQIPGAIGMFVAGNLIGSVSALVGIGGGSMSVPFMIWCNVKVKKAIGTSAAIGFPIAVSGALGFVINGLGVRELPGGSLGFVYLPAMLGVAVVSIFTAPLGAWLTHVLPADKLKMVFALFVIVVSSKLLYSAW